MKQIKVSFSEEVWEKISLEAKMLGVSPSAIIRFRQSERVLGFKLDTSAKPYLVQMPDWKKLEAYVLLKNAGPVEKFLVDAAESVMRRNGLTPVQKVEAKTLLEK
jgi:hypothetical protein